MFKAVVKHTWPSKFGHGTRAHTEDIKALQKQREDAGIIRYFPF